MFQGPKCTQTDSHICSGVAERTRVEQPTVGVLGSGQIGRWCKKESDICTKIIDNSWVVTGLGLGDGGGGK